MRINFSDLAQILQMMRDTEDFDGKNDIHEFMDRLDDLGDREIEIRQVHGVTMYSIETED